MDYIKEEFSVLSSDGIHRLAGVLYRPTGEPKGLFHIVHGMTEYIGRYERILCELAKQGWIAFGYDNLGHGNTARDADELGYIADRNGWELLARDVGVFSDAVRERLSAQELPYCLMGHSMGSFIVRLAAARYVRPTRLIIMGTGGKNPAAGAGLALIACIKALRGGHHVSGLIDSIVFGAYNKRFETELADAPSPWLTTDKEVRLRYAQDPFCTFRFTVSAMGDLIRLLKYTNDKSWFRDIPKTFPILLVSGEEDPVGNYGKGVREVEQRLVAAGANARAILYKGARHEILNDFTYPQVLADILAFTET